MLDRYLEMIEMDFFEIGEAFKGLQDQNVWRRPAESLLSIGEIAGHIAYWEAGRFAGGKRSGDHRLDLSDCKVASPLLDHCFADYTEAMDKPPTNLDMTAEQTYSELLRVHHEAVGHLKALNPDLQSQVPGGPTGLTYQESVKYTIFHVAYHTGQIYSVRHLLGEITPDN